MMTFGSSRSAKKPSDCASVLLAMLLFRLDSPRPVLPLVLLALVLRAKLEPALVELPLRPRKAYLPYPSWPVPAAGPFFLSFSLGGGGATGSAGVLGRRLNRPKRECDFPVLMLAGLVPRGGGIRSSRSADPSCESPVR